jgi:hypothetical protein
MKMAPKSEHEIPVPLRPERAKVIKNLRMIADDIERGYDGFDCFIGYDFINITDDIRDGEAKRNERSVTLKDDNPLKNIEKTILGQFLLGRQCHNEK